MRTVSVAMYFFLLIMPRRSFLSRALVRVGWEVVVQLCARISSMITCCLAAAAHMSIGRGLQSVDALAGVTSATRIASKMLSLRKVCSIPWEL